MKGEGDRPHIVQGFRTRTVQLGKLGIRDFKDVLAYADLLLFFRIIQLSQQGALFSFTPRTKCQKWLRVSPFKSELSLCLRSLQRDSDIHGFDHQPARHRFLKVMKLPGQSQPP